MKNISMAIGLVLATLVIAGISYSWGHRDGTLAGLDRQYSSLYSSASLEIRLLELLKANEHQRAMSALSAYIKSDLSFLDEIYAVRNEVTILNVLRSLASRPVNSLPVMNEPDLAQLTSLKEQFAHVAERSSSNDKQ
jgi:hypothetical protein